MGLWSWFKGLLGRSDDKGESKLLVAFVLFLREPRYLDAEIVARLASEAWCKEIRVGETEDADNFVFGTAPTFVMRSGDYMYLVNNFPTPYMEDPEVAAQEIDDLRLRKHVAEHRAWLSVDALGEYDEEKLPEIYGYIGKLTAALADTDCLAIYSPATGQMNIYEPELEQR
jgi:hypothetical protein